MKTSSLLRVSGAVLGLFVLLDAGSDSAVAIGSPFTRPPDAQVASIRILDPDSDLPTKEVIVNEGNSVKLKLLVLDTNGMPRDDFILTYSSLSPEIATVDSSGVVQGIKAGFSTLSVGSGGAVTVGTITVVTVDSGFGGFDINGLTQDLAGRLYLASTSNHSILLLQELRGAPAVYAGVVGMPGFRNDVRLQSMFNNPAFLALNHFTGSLYVSDAANHGIGVDPFGSIYVTERTSGRVRRAPYKKPKG